MFRRIFGRPRRAATEALYRAIVAQARQPAFYAELAAPDTEEGRFDMIVLHLVLTMRRLRGLGEEGRALSQDLFDTFFRDMDRSLREMGVGDLVVPKRIRRMGEAFYGRAARYDAALDAGDEDALAEALAANVLGRERDQAAERLARYAMAGAAELDTAGLDELRRAAVGWPRI